MRVLTHGHLDHRGRSGRQRDSQVDTQSRRVSVLQTLLPGHCCTERMQLLYRHKQQLAAQ